MNKTYKCEGIRSKSDLNNNLKSLVCEFKKKKEVFQKATEQD